MRSAHRTHARLRLRVRVRAFARVVERRTDHASTGRRRRPRRPPASAATTCSAIGDKLRVEVYREPQLSQSVEVRPDGKITLPLVGDVSAAGSTPRALGQSLSEKLKDT